MSPMEKCAMCAAVCGLLFFVLSPGVLLTIPTGKGCKTFMALKNAKSECATSYKAAAVHALLFALCCFGVCMLQDKM